MFETRRDLVLIGCVSVGFVISAGRGLVARAAEPDRWARAIAASASTTGAAEDAAQRRIAELEQRVRELEAERHAPPSDAKSAERAAVTARSDELAARNLVLATKSQEGGQRRSLGSFDSGACRPPGDADPKAQLRYWAQQIRAGETSSRRLSPEWNAAVNVLVRGERQLDPRNPWRDP
jgi:hypothetical protein